jgi:biotin carboxyl carrier protein
MSRYQVTIDDRDFDIELDLVDDRLIAVVDGKKVDVSSRQLGETRTLLFINNESYEVDIRINGGSRQRIVFMKGLEIPAAVQDYNLAQLRKAAGTTGRNTAEGTVKAPMPGMVVGVKVREGDKVKKGMPLVVIEAMKMENIIKAKGEGTVKSILVTKGKSVEKGDRLLEFE